MVQVRFGVSGRHVPVENPQRKKAKAKPPGLPKKPKGNGKATTSDRRTLGNQATTVEELQPEAEQIRIDVTGSIAAVKQRWQEDRADKACSPLSARRLHGGLRSRPTRAEPLISRRQAGRHSYACVRKRQRQERRNRERLR